MHECAITDTQQARIFSTQLIMRLQATTYLRIFYLIFSQKEDCKSRLHTKQVCTDFLFAYSPRLTTRISKFPV